MGAIGVLVATMGCASCFPAPGALAASMELGFLAHYKGALLPVFVWIGLVANIILFISHRRVVRFLPEPA